MNKVQLQRSWLKLVRPLSNLIHDRCSCTLVYSTVDSDLTITQSIECSLCHSRVFWCDYVNSGYCNYRGVAGSGCDVNGGALLPSVVLSRRNEKERKRVRYGTRTGSRIVSNAESLRNRQDSNTQNCELLRLPLLVPFTDQGGGEGEFTRECCFTLFYISTYCRPILILTCVLLLVSYYV